MNDMGIKHSAAHLSLSAWHWHAKATEQHTLLGVQDAARKARALGAL